MWCIQCHKSAHTGDDGEIEDISKLFDEDICNKSGISPTEAREWELVLGEKKFI